MKDNITIIVLDNETNQPKYYNFKGFVKKVAVWGIAIVLGLGIGVTFFIFYMQQEMKRLNIIQDKLKQENQKLLQLNQKLEGEIDQKTEQFAALKAQVDEIRRVLGYKIETPASRNVVSSVEDEGVVTPEGNLTTKTNIQLSTLLKQMKHDSLERQFWFRQIPSGKPVRYKRIGSRFGIRRHPFRRRRWEFHKGIDLSARVGTKVVSTADGLVVSAVHSNRGYGNVIILQHNFGFSTLYGHLHKIYVTPGQYVKKGEAIGEVGSTGLSTSPHLHYEVRFLARPFNPYYFLKWGPKNFDKIFKKVKGIPWQSLAAMIHQMFLLLTKPLSSPEAQKLSAKSKSKMKNSTLTEKSQGR